MNWKSVQQVKDPGNISKVEQEWDVKFPQEFKSEIVEHNYGSPNPNSFDTEHLKGKSFGRMLDFNLDREDNILDEYNLIKNNLPPYVFPFAGDAGGNYLCFDYRNGSDNPTIVFWDHEQIFEIEDNELIIPDHENENQYYRLEFVSENLQELFDKLYGEVEEEKEPIEEVIWEKFMDEEKMKGLSDGNLAAVNRRRQQQGLPKIVK